MVFPIVEGCRLESQLNKLFPGTHDISKVDGKSRLQYLTCLLNALFSVNIFDTISKVAPNCMTWKLK